MNANKKLIEYYFFHYDEHFNTCSKKLVAFTNTMYPFNSALLYSGDEEFGTADFLNIMMSKVVQKTYRYFRENKRYIIKSRYFLRHKRAKTCKKLDISPRTYHRYLDEILSYASSYLEVLLIERMEYEKNLKFFASKAEIKMPPPEYFSSHTLEI
ncbi:MAG: hypothetical protein R3Y32_03540 [Bacillota bacterium]